MQFSALGGLADLDLSTCGGHVDVDIRWATARCCGTSSSRPCTTWTVQLDVESAGSSTGPLIRSPLACARSRRRVRSSAINGRPIFLRGTLECCIFPLTGYPPTDAGGVEAHHRHLPGARLTTSASIPGARPRPPLWPPTSWASTTRSRCSIVGQPGRGYRRRPAAGPMALRRGRPHPAALTAIILRFC